MEAGGTNPGSGRKPLNAGNPGPGGKVWQKQKDSSGMLLFGVIFLLVLALIVVAVGYGLWCVGTPLIRQYEDMQRGYHAGGMPASPTVIVKPDVAPGMFIREKLKESSEIVGLWESTAVRTLYTSTDSHNYNLTIYNDHTYIIYDKSRDTYVVGTWSGGPVEYGISEPGKNVHSRILGGFDSLEFQYDANGNDYTDKTVFVDYARVYYPGLYQDLV